MLGVKKHISGNLQDADIKDKVSNATFIAIALCKDAKL